MRYKLTPDEIVTKIGLKLFTQFCDPIQSLAEVYGCEPRRSGRTTRSAILAMSAASEGKRVIFVAGSEANRRRISSLLLDIALKAEIDALEHGPSGIKIAGGGEVRLVAPLEPFSRCDEIVRDHYDPLAREPRSECLHRLARARRSCAVCGLKLRSVKDIKRARLRQRMMADRRVTWDHLGISAIEARFRPKPPGKTQL